MRRLGPLAPGTYLFAMTLDGARVSNVAEVAIDPVYTPERAARLRLLAIQPPPGESDPVLAIQAVGPSREDPAFTNFAVYSADLFVDGRLAPRRGIGWGGIISPIRPGDSFAAYLGAVVKLPDPAHPVTAQARVGKYQSEPITLPPPYEAEAAWDRGSSGLSEAPLPAALLSGTVKGVVGQLANGYRLELVELTGDPGAMPQDLPTYREVADEQGRYAFAAVPPGQYTLSCDTETGYDQNQAGARLYVVAVELRRGHPTTLDLDLEQRHMFSGRVTDSQGDPLAGAHVQAEWRLDAEGRPLSGPQVSIADEPAKPQRCFQAWTRSDTNGDYRLGAPYEYVTSLRVGLSGYTDYTMEGSVNDYEGVLDGREDVDLVLLTAQEAAEEMRAR